MLRTESAKMNDGRVKDFRNIFFYQVTIDKKRRHSKMQVHEED
jgi:hypothetical protein